MSNSRRYKRKILYDLEVVTASEILYAVLDSNEN